MRYHVRPDSTGKIVDKMNEYEDTQVNHVPPNFLELAQGRTRTITRPYFFPPQRIKLEMIG